MCGRPSRGGLFTAALAYLLLIQGIIAALALGQTAQAAAQQLVICTVDSANGGPNGQTDHGQLPHNPCILHCQLIGALHPALPLAAQLVEPVALDNGLRLKPQASDHLPLPFPAWRPDARAPPSLSV